LAKSQNEDDSKQDIAKFISIWKRKLSDLLDATSRDGLNGASHWFKSHHQTEDLSAALEDLLVASEQDDFQLLQVETTLASFVIPEDDLGQAEWYKTAHNYLIAFEEKLVKKNVFDIKLLQAAQSELKYISQSNEFHQRYRLKSIQEKVTQMYQTLQQSLIDYKTIEQQKNQTLQDESNQKLTQIEAEKAQAVAKKAMIDNIKMKEKRIAIMEEKKRLQAEKELVSAQEVQQREEFELQSKQAELERQAKLQESYLDLQLEEKISNWNIEDYISKMRSKISHEELTPTQQESIAEFIDFLKTKN
jgi:hypothetical protein